MSIQLTATLTQLCHIKRDHHNVLKMSTIDPLTPHQGLCPWTPLGALPPDPRIGSRSARSPWVRASPGFSPLPQLKIPGAATGHHFSRIYC